MNFTVEGSISLHKTTTMYHLPHFKEPDPGVIRDFMHAHPFVMLIGTRDGKPFATQVPVLIEEKEGNFVFRGHMMRNQDHHKAFTANNEVLAVFTGPTHYVSATWYSNPNQASTWNYLSVHARGKINFLDEEGLARMLQDQTLHFEKGDTSSPTVFANLPMDYREKLMKSIQAFEIKVYELGHVLKLSQNRDEESYASIVERLREQGGEAGQLATLMDKRKDRVFRGDDNLP